MWKFWLGGLALLIICALASDRPLWQPERVLGFAENVQIEEAKAIWHGRLDLPERRWDTALFGGRVYSYFPPMFTFIAALFVPFFDGVPHLFLVVLAAAMVLLAYALFVRLSGSIAWGMFLTLGLVMGTSHWPVLERMLRGGTPYNVNHVLATIGLLMMLISLAYDRWIGLACIGLAIAALSRQMTLAYAGPLLIWAWRRRKPSSGRASVWCACGTVVAVLLITLANNTLKFADPIDSGYIHNYEGRDDAFARDAREFGLFAAHYVPRNLYYATIATPWLHGIGADGQRAWYLHADDMGAGVLWTTPLLLWAVFEGRRLSKDRLHMALLGSVFVIFSALLFWHGTGSVQRGFNRYSLDYLPVLFAILVPGCLVTNKRRWLTVLMVSWSILYFAVLLPRPNIRVW